MIIEEENLLKKGDKVVMHTCLESETYDGKVWTVASDEKITGEGIFKQGLVFLKGFSSKFNTKYLQKVKLNNESITHDDLNDYENLSVEQKILLIREFNQINLYSVNEDWCIQLFDWDICANDGCSCNWEGSSRDLNELLNYTLEYISEVEYRRINDI
ncbi:TPA: hypothetical protein ACF0PM_002200 [Clostridium perfringens]